MIHSIRILDIRQAKEKTFRMAKNKDKFMSIMFCWF